MPNINYYNQSAPFWDWVASMEEQGQNHPWFANRGEEGNGNGSNPWYQGAPAMPGGFPLPTRGASAFPQPPPPPPVPQSMQPPPPPQPPQATATSNNDQEGQAEPSDAGGAAATSDEPPQAGPSTRGPGSRRGRGCGVRGHGRGPWGSGRGGWFGGPQMHPAAGLFGNPGLGHGNFGELANQFQEALFGGAPKKDENEDFKPEVDVFDGAEAFVVHVSLPGAKKEDVGVNWDAEKSELSIAGVVYRPGDEEFLQTLAMNERKIGAFERKVRLGSRANPAAVDVDGIHARMEDGVLVVEIPKILDDGFVELKKVPIE